MYRGAWLRYPAWFDSASQHGIVRLRGPEANVRARFSLRFGGIRVGRLIKLDHLLKMSVTIGSPLEREVSGVTTPRD